VFWLRQLVMRRGAFGIGAMPLMLVLRLFARALLAFCRPPQLAGAVVDTHGRSPGGACSALDREADLPLTLPASFAVGRLAL
jgi:hypothetical protein